MFLKVKNARMGFKSIHTIHHNEWVYSVKSLNYEISLELAIFHKRGTKHNKQMEEVL